jgi:hypothetical protein
MRTSVIGKGETFRIRFLGLLFLLPNLLFAAGATVSWQANTETDLAGYQIYYGTSHNFYSVILDVGNVTTYNVTGLTAGTTYYFAVTAVDQSGNESESSTEVAYKVEDTAPPTVASVSCTGGDLVKVIFSEPVEKTSAELASNYSINNGIVVQRGELQSDLKTVHLVTTQHANRYYILTINNVKDRATVPNAIAAGTTKEYSWEGGDQAPPTITGVELIRSDYLVITFSEALDQTSALILANYAISPAVSIQGIGINNTFNKVTLNTAAHASGTSYTLTVNNVKDASGSANTIAANSKVTYICNTGDATPPVPVAARITTASQLQIEFSETVETVSAQTVSNYTISPTVTVSGAVLNTAKTTVTLTTSAHAAGNFTVTVRNIKDLNATPNTLTSASLNYAYTPADVTSPALVQAVLSTNTYLKVTFSEAVDPVTAQTLSNYVISPSVAVQSAMLDVTQKNVVLTTAPHAAGSYTLRVSNVRDIATVPNTIAANSASAYTYAPGDVEPPALRNVILHGANMLELVFSEPLDRTSAETASNYTVSGGVSVTAASLVGTGLNQVYLTTGTHTPGQTYTVTIAGIRDKATVPNIIPASIQAGYTYQVADAVAPRLLAASLQGGNQWLELTFSEPLDPATAQAVSNYTLSNGIQVIQATLNDAGTGVFLKTAAHVPGTAYTVTVKNVKDLASPGNVIGSDNQKSYTCVSQDVLPPQLVRAELMGVNVLELVFNEPLNLTSAATAANYTVSGGISVIKAAVDNNQTQVFLTTTPHQRGSYTVTVKGLKDIAATPNTLVQAQTTYTYTPADTTAPVLLSSTAVNAYTIELLFSEALDRTSAEMAANYSVSSGVVVKTATLDVAAVKVLLATSQQLEGSYTVTINNVFDASGSNRIRGNTASQYAFASIDLTKPTITAVSLRGDNMLVVDFSEALSQESAQAIANYRINNSVEVKSAYLTLNNKEVVLGTSAHSAGSYTLTVNGVTDASSQRNAIVQYSQAQYVWNPPDTIRPTLLSVTLHSINLLELKFSEKIGATEATKAVNYAISPQVPVISAVLDNSQASVWLYTGNHDKGTYSVTVSNVKDLAFTPNGIGNPKTAMYQYTPPDTVPPLLVNVNLRTPMNLVVTFDEAVSRESAETLANYTIEPPVQITQASLLASLNTVQLETKAHASRTNYVLKVKGIKDRAPVVNTIVKTATWSYNYLSADTTPPALIDGKLRHPSLLELVFNEPIEASSAENRENYTIDPSVEVLSVTLDTSTMKKVYLNTTTHIPGVGYGVNVRNVRDQATVPNTISASTWFSYSLASGLLADKTPPALVRVDFVSTTQIDLIFSERVDVASAQNPANYIVTDSVTVQSARVDSNEVKVHLVTTAHRIGKRYQVTAKNIRDRATTPNVLAQSPAVKYIMARGAAVSNPSRAGTDLAIFNHGGAGYADRSYAVSQAPDYLNGAAQILTLNEDKASTGSNFLSFELRGGATVYAAVDKQLAAAPAWLAGWKATGEQVVDSRNTVYALYSMKSLGGQIVLGGNGGTADQNMYLVFVVPSMVNGTLLSKLNIPSYSVAQTGVGDAYYIDRDYTITAIPDSAAECLWIRTANDDKTKRDSEFLTFELSEPSEISVAYDSRIASLPKWLVDWEASGEQIVDSRGVRFELLKKTYEAGEVVLGGNCGSSDDNMYFVLLKSRGPKGSGPYMEQPGYFTISRNYPNPFNPETSITYRLHKNGRMKLTVFNILGQRVAVLVDADFKAGDSGVARWNGSDEAGRPVSSGVYFYRIEQDRFAKTGRMLLVR